MKTPAIIQSVLSRFKRQPRPAVQYRIVERDVCRMTMAEWKATPDLCKVAAKALHDPIVRHMLDVCRTEHLANYSPSGPLTIEQRAVHCARIEGYGIMLNNFESLGQFEKEKEPLVETFEVPDSQPN